MFPWFNSHTADVSHLIMYQEEINIVYCLCLRLSLCRSVSLYQHCLPVTHLHEILRKIIITTQVCYLVDKASDPPNYPPI